VSQNPARQLKRRIQRESKVVGEIPGAPGQPAPGNEGKAPEEGVKEIKQKLPITLDQANLLKDAQAKVTAAQQEVETLLKMVLAQHHVNQARVVQVLDSRPPALEILVPAPKRKPKGR